MKELTPLPPDQSPHDLLLPCPECDLVVAVALPEPGQQLSCPRCAYPLARYTVDDQTSPALIITALLFLLIALFTPYIGFQKSGLSNAMTLLEAATQLAAFHHPLLGILVFGATVVLPLCFLGSLLWVHFSLADMHAGEAAPAPLPGTAALLRALPRWRPWLMTDVFAIGALVSLIKIAGMADVQLLAGFWAYTGCALALLVILQRFEPLVLWSRLCGPPRAPTAAEAGRSSHEQGLVGCNTCGQLQSIHDSLCQRCGSRLHPRQRHSLQRTGAYLATAALCCFPAQLYPIMNTTSLGHHQPATIIAGVLQFLQHGDWPIAVVIFVASILIPFGKIMALAWLCFGCRRAAAPDMAAQMRLYRITEWVGRWSMIDVFVVAIVVALVRLGNVLSIQPGPGGVAFAAVVIFTMLAAASFDPRLLWDHQRQHDDSMAHTQQQHSAYEQDTSLQ